MPRKKAVKAKIKTQKAQALPRIKMVLPRPKKAPRPSRVL
jgi:hypothetical protein